MAVGGRVLGEAFIVISPDTDDFLRDLTAKVKAAVTAVPQQDVKVGADTSAMSASMARVRSELAAVTARVANIKFGADDTAINAAVSKMLSKVALLDKQMRSMELAADPAKMDAAIAKETTKLVALKAQLRTLEMGADTSKIDAAIRRETALLFRLREQMSALKLEADDADLAYKIARDDALLDTLNKKIAEKRKLGADTSLLEAQLEAVETRLALLRQRGRIVLSAEQSTLFGQLVAAENRLERLRAEASDIKLMNPAQIASVQAQIAATTAEIGALRAEADRVRLGGLSMAEITSVAAGIAGLNDEVTRLNTSLAGTAIGPPGEALGRLRNQAALLDAALTKARVDLAGEPAAEAKLARLELMAEKLKATLSDLSIGGDPVKLAAAAAAVATMTSGLRGLAPAINDTEGAWARLQGWAFKGGGGFWGLGGAIGGVSLWHVALDGVIEAIIAVTGAVIAASAGIAVLAETGKDVVTRLNAVRTVNAALGTEIPPMTGKFDDLVKAMAPRGIEIFGGALNIVSSQSQNLRKVIEPVVDLFDRWVAEIDIWVAHQQTFAGAVTHGTTYLAQFGQIVGQITEAIHNLLSKDPGIAHYLLDILVAASGLFDAFTKLPKPIVELTIGLHGLYVWAAVLGAVFLKMVNPLVQMVGWVTRLGTASKAAAAEVALLSETQLAGAAATDGAAVAGLGGALGRAGGAARAFGAGLAALAANPFVWAAAAIALIGGIVYEMHQAGAAAKDFIGDMTGALNQMKASDAIPAIEADIGRLNDKIKSAFGPENITAITSTFGGNSLISLGRFKSNLIAMGDAAVGFKNIMVGVFTQDGAKILDGFTGLVSSFHAKHDAAMHQAGEEVKAYGAELTNLKKTQGDYFLTLGNLIRQHYGVAESFALMDLAGVKATDTYAIMVQKVKNLVDGYKSITGTGGALEASVNAVTFAALQQQEKVGQLNSGWDTFIKTIEGGESGFNAFATQTEGLYQSLSNAGVKLSDSNGKVSMSTKLAADAAQGGKVSMTGLNTASLQARDTFLKTADSANQQMDALSLLANAAGKGQQGVDMLNQANKDMVASMLPAAKGSQAMTDILYALAQRGGYRGADSFKALSQWVGKTKDPMKDLDGITTTLTTDAADLAGDVKNLSIALGTTLNDAMAQAIITANGGQKIFTSFADAVLKTGLGSKRTHDTAQQLAQSLLNLTGNTREAHNQFLTFAQEALHLTHDQAEKLWKSVAGKLNPALSDAAGWARKGKDDFEKFAGEGGKQGLGLTAKQADHLWKKLSKDGLGGVLADLANSKAPNARAEFEKLAGDKTHGLGLTHAQADKLWNKLHGDLGKELTALAGAQGSVPQSKKAFEDWAGAGGKSGLSLTTKQADALYQVLGGAGKGGLKQAIDNLPTKKTITITADASGADKVLTQMEQRLGRLPGGGTLGPSGRAAIGKQHGGLITHGTGPTADDVHLLASRGEYVMRAAAVSHYGTHVMDALNAGVLHPGLLGAVAGHRAGGGSVGYAYAGGGPVGYQAGGAVTGGGIGGTLGALAGAIAQMSSSLATLFTQKIPGWMGSFSAEGKTAFTRTGASLQTELGGKLQDLFTQKMPDWWGNRVSGDAKTAWARAAGSQQAQYGNPTATLFTKTLPGYWDTHVAADGKAAWTDAANAQQTQFGAPTATLFGKTIPGYWGSHVTGDGKTAFTSTASNMQSIFAAPMSALFTTRIPSWLTGFVGHAKTAFQVSQGNFSSLMSTPIGKSIASWSGDIAKAFRSGWNVVAGLFNNNVINWINNNILKHLPGGLSIARIPTFAGGGRVSLGSGPTADDVPAMLSRGELVVPTRMVDAGAVDHLRGKLPGFAAGGVAGYQGGGLALKSPTSGSGAVWPQLWGAVRSSGIPGLSLTSTTTGGHVGGSYHFLGKAIDVGGPDTGSTDPRTPMNALYRWIHGKYQRQTAELIHWPYGGIKNGQDVPGSFWGSVWLGHKNHVHWASNGLGGPGFLGKITGIFQAIWQNVEGLLDSAGAGLSSLVSPLGRFIGGGPKALLGLAQKGAQAIFSAVWDHSVRPLIGKLPLGTMPGGFAGALADKLKTGIGKFMGAKDSAAQKQAASMGGIGNVPPASGSALAAQKFAQAHLKDFGWGTAQWPPLLSLWQGESGWNANAVNPSSGAAGIPQALGHGHVFNLGDYANQVIWGLNYIKGTYGSPASAYSKWLGRSPHWYDKGGVLPPGLSLVMNGTGRDETVIPAPPHEVTRFAAGGVAGYQQALSADQSAETRAYRAFTAAARSSLAHAAPGSYVASHHASILGEMTTLAKRQASEAAAYKAVAGAHLTAGDIRHFITMIKDEIATSKDIALSHLPGGTLASLRSLLATMETRTHTEPVLPPRPAPVMPSGLPPVYATSAAALRKMLAAAQVRETADYAGLRKAFLSGPARYRTAVTVSELGTLASRQASEAAAYKALAGSGLTAANLGKFGSAARAEARTALDQALNRLPGGHPGWAGGLRYWLGYLMRVTAGGFGGIPPVWADLPRPDVMPAVNPAIALMASLAAAQAHEVRDWRGLHDAFTRGPRKYRTTAAMTQLAALGRTQAAEERAYRDLARSGLSAATSTAMKLAVTAETGASHAAALSHLPGGHPVRVKTLDWWLGQVGKLAATRLAPWESPAPVPPPPAPALATLAGEFSFDRGGWLEPGWNPPMYNGTGAREHLAPDDGSAREVHIHLHNHGVVGSRAELDAWLGSSLDRLSRRGRLDFAFKRSFSAT